MHLYIMPSCFSRRAERLRRMQYMSAATGEEIVPVPNTGPVDVIADCAQCTLERVKDEKIPLPFSEGHVQQDGGGGIKSYDVVKEYTVYMGKPMTAKQFVAGTQSRQNCPASFRPHFYEQPKVIQ